MLLTLALTSRPSLAVGSELPNTELAIEPGGSRNLWFKQSLTSPVRVQDIQLGWKSL